MLILPIDDAKPGMQLAAPVFHPDSPDQELLKRGYVLEAKVLRRMAEMGVDALYVDYPGLDDLDRHLAVNLSPARQAVSLVFLVTRFKRSYSYWVRFPFASVAVSLFPALS